MSIVKYYGSQMNSRCGYCKGHSSNSNGMHSYTLSPRDYQDLIDRGWRRSGQYCYKPNNRITCCPCYTIKCDTQEFKLSKSHKKILKRMNRFLTDGVKHETPGTSANANVDRKLEENGDLNDMDDANVGKSDHISIANEAPDLPNISIPKIDAEAISQEIQLSQMEGASGLGAADTKMEVVSEARRELKKSSMNSQDTLAKLPCKKAKQMRIERKQMKLAQKGISQEITKPKPAKNEEKSLADFINDVPEHSRHKLKIALVEVNSYEFRSSLAKSFALYARYQTVIHNDPPEDLNEYLQFLQQSPVKNHKTSGGPADGFGSFHQQYWLDDKLIAIGVIDILPYAVSSVYFFYDPDYSFLSLGTYGSLREIYFTRQLSETCPELKFYYMGFYIHSCPKMRYKGKLSASYLLCPEVYSWHLLTDEIRNKLNQCKYQRLNEDLAVKDVNEFNINDLNSVLILIDGRRMTYRQYLQSINYESVEQILGLFARSFCAEIADDDNDERDAIFEYGVLVGKTCAHRMTYVK